MKYFSHISNCCDFSLTYPLQLLGKSRKNTLSLTSVLNLSLVLDVDGILHYRNPWGCVAVGFCTLKAILKQLRDELWEKLVQEAIEVGKCCALEVDGSPSYDLLAVQGAIPPPACIDG